MVWRRRRGRPGPRRARAGPAPASAGAAKRKGPQAQGPADLRAFIWSGRRDLNPRPFAWQANALPLSYSRSKRILVRAERLELSRAGAHQLLRLTRLPFRHARPRLGSIAGHGFGAQGDSPPVRRSPVAGRGGPFAASRHAYWHQDAPVHPPARFLRTSGGVSRSGPCRCRPASPAFVPGPWSLNGRGGTGRRRMRRTRAARDREGPLPGCGLLPVRHAEPGEVRVRQPRAASPGKGLGPSAGAMAGAPAPRCGTP